MARRTEALARRMDAAAAALLAAVAKPKEEEEEEQQQERRNPGELRRANEELNRELDQVSRSRVASQVS